MMEEWNDTRELEDWNVGIMEEWIEAKATTRKGRLEEWKDGTARTGMME